MSMLPTHPRNGMQALGFRKDGRPIWPIRGAEDTPPTETPPGDAPPKENQPGPPDPAQDGDKTDWKAEARKWEGRAKENRTAADEAKALKDRLDKLSPLEKLAEALGADATQDPDKVEQLAERVTKHEEDLAAERDLRWRAQIANDKGLTLKQAARLVGKTKEELAADADELVKEFEIKGESKKGPHVPRSGTGEGGAPKGSVSAGRDLFKSRRKSPQQTT